MACASSHLADHLHHHNHQALPWWFFLIWFLPAVFCCLRFGIGIFYVLLYQLLKVAFHGAAWLVQIGNVVQLGYLFLLIVQLIINLKCRPETVEKIHSFCAIYFCLYMLMFTGVSIRWVGGGGSWRQRRHDPMRPGTCWQL